jgi:hypothetical protein
MNNKGQDKIQNKVENSKKKVYKIKYILNLLPGTINRDLKDGELLMMEVLSETEELDIFRTKVVYDLVEFKWNAYAKYIHYLGASLHLAYNIVFFIYVNTIYNERNFAYQYDICWIMLILLIYPMVYDMLQLFKTGPFDYFSDPWNYLDQGHIWFGVANIFI